MKRIIINGANGYVASNFINELLLNNYEVIALVRESKKQLPSERMGNALAEINDGKYTKPENLQVYGYSLIEENFSLSEKVLTDIFSKSSDYFHFAASLKYDFKSRGEIFETNLMGVENSINVFSKYGSMNSRFFFVSTVYSCGRISDLFLEDFYENEDISSFRNYYEQSKRWAENIVREHIEDKHLNGHVLRLSQVVGNNKTGVTKTDYGIFDFAKRIYDLSNKHPDQTIRVRIDPDSTQNLISIDTVTDYLLKILEVEQLPVITNLAAKKSQKNIDIVNSLNKLLPVKIIPDKLLETTAMTALERMVSIGMSFTGSYAETNLWVDTKNLDKIAETGINEIDEYSIFQMLKYFIDRLAEKKRYRIANSVCCSGSDDFG